jgi:hypothetical protein
MGNLVGIRTGGVLWTLFVSGPVLFLSSGVRNVALAQPVVHAEPPQILGKIRCHSWKECAGPNREFTAAVQQRFALGTLESDLKEILFREGFSLDEKSPATCLRPGQYPRVGELSVNCPDWDPHWNPRNRLSYWWARNAACSDEIVVLWSTDNQGAITYIEGRFDGGCL